MVKLGVGAYRERFLEGWEFCVSHFDVLEIQDFVIPDNLESPAVIAEYKAMLEDFSGEVTLHGPYINLVPTSIDNKIREVAEFRYLQGVEAAEKLSAKMMVIHSFYDLKSGYSDYDDFWLEENLKFWSRFLEKIEGSGITILLENCHDQQPEVFSRLISAIGNPRFGSCLDLGHCNCLSPYRPQEWVARVKGYYFHISDNDGKSDSHSLPGMGSIDFEEIAKMLRGSSGIYLISESDAAFAAQFQSLSRLKEMILD